MESHYNGHQITITRVSIKQRIDCLSVYLIRVYHICQSRRKGTKVLFAAKKGLASYSKCDRMFFVWEFSFPQLHYSHALFVFYVIYLLVLA